jgi:anti-sigma regulatory factor (Ser/Thr protein kinase)
LSGASPDPPGSPDPRTASAITLPHAAGAAGVARAYLRRQANLIHPPTLQDALILTSELVTNAIRHGRPAVTLAVHLEPSALTVVVTDTGPERPPLVPRRPHPDSSTGRGLVIVDALATRWGITPQPASPGKAVWFALDLHQRRPRHG